MLAISRRSSRHADRARVEWVVNTTGIQHCSTRCSPARRWRRCSLKASMRRHRCAAGRLDAGMRARNTSVDDEQHLLRNHLERGVPPECEPTAPARCVYQHPLRAVVQPMFVVPGDAEYVTLDMDVCYDTEDDPNFNILAFDGVLLRIADLTAGRLLRSVSSRRSRRTSSRRGRSSTTRSICRETATRPTSRMGTCRSGRANPGASNTCGCAWPEWPGARPNCGSNSRRITWASAATCGRVIPAESRSTTSS